MTIGFHLISQYDGSLPTGSEAKRFGFVDLADQKVIEEVPLVVLHTCSSGNVRNAYIGERDQV